MEHKRHFKCLGHTTLLPIKTKSTKTRYETPVLISPAVARHPGPARPDTSLATQTPGLRQAGAVLISRAPCHPPLLPS